jgi:hypothetical protein
VDGAYLKIIFFNGIDELSQANFIGCNDRIRVGFNGLLYQCGRKAFSFGWVQ